MLHTSCWMLYSDSYLKKIYLYLSLAGNFRENFSLCLDKHFPID